MAQQGREGAAPRDRYITDPVVAICLAFVLCGAVSFGLWSATAPLAQGVTAGGTLIVEDRRRRVQHLEGGIIQKIQIREGDRIDAGALAMIISDAGSEARFSQARAEELRLLAALDRVDAQISGAAELSFARLGAAGAAADEGTALMRLNQALFDDQRAAHAGEKALVAARISRLSAERGAIDVRRAGKRREIATLRDEAEVQSTALSQRMGNISRVNELARLLAITETELANLDEEERVIERAMGEARLELTQIDLTYRAGLSEAFSEISGELAAVSDQVRALRDRQRRSHVIAPVDGVVIDLAFTAEGGVVAPGEPVFDIVPSEAQYQVEVRFQPQDRDDLAEGRAVNLRFGTLDPINPPQISGTLATIAADASFDPQSKSFYYLSKIAIDPAALSALADYSISPGIPVEVFFDKGTPRTPLSYFIEPVAEMLRLGMRS